MSSIPTKLEKCTGAMLASAIGDALGWPNESRASNTSKKNEIYDYFVGWTRRCSGANWHYEKIMPGEYSDDTQMILAVARSIIAGNWESIFCAKELPYWLEYQRGGGRALLKAADACKKGRLLWQSNYPREYFNAGGNGATMRILPHVIAASKENNINDLIATVIKDSIITHGHPRAILGSTCYAYALDYLLRKDSVLEYGELVTAVLDYQNIWGAIPDSAVFGEWLEVAMHNSDYDYINEWNLVLSNMTKQLEYIRVSLKKGLMLDDNNVMRYLECFGKANGAGDVAVLAGIYLVSKYANNPTLGIKTPAFSFGADTDTIASITGGLLGMLCGVNWIPIEWKAVQDYDCLIHVTEMLLSDNMAEAAKNVVDTVKGKYDEWQQTPIGKMRLVGTSIISNSRATTVSVSKWESTLGQTLYFKEFKQNVQDSNYKRKNQESAISKAIPEGVMHSAVEPRFVLDNNDIIFLLSMPQLQRITFKKVLKVIEMIFTNKNTTASIANKFDIDPSIVDFIKSHVKV